MDQVISQTQTVRQEQTLSARQLQGLSLLHAPVMELQERLTHELTVNPVLEEVSSAAEPPAGESGGDGPEGEETRDDADEALTAEQLVLNADNWCDELPVPPDDSADNSGDEDAAVKHDYLLNSATREATLQERLLSELRFSDVDDREFGIGESVIGCIDDSGYLRTHPADIAMAEGVSLEDVEKMLSLIRTFDPPGVGAFTLRECLRLQLERGGERDPRLFELIDRHLGDVGDNRLPQIARALKVSMDELNLLLEKLRNLRPYPAASMSSRAVFVAPELEIVKEGGRYVVKPPARPQMRLRISDRYLKMLDDDSLTDADRSYIREKISSARELLRALEMRGSTITRIAEVIADEQSAFFDNGVAFLRPMTMRHVANLIGMHETTVSRAVTGKYLQTPRGFLEFRYFFSNGLRADDGEDVSSRSVQDAIRRLIHGENPRKPLSDEKISQMLRESGLGVARRTVAKYREKMRIAPTRLRRCHC